MQSKVTPIETLYEVKYQSQEVNQVALELLNRFSQLKIWALEGPLGSGKTTLSKAIFKALGVKDDVTSPTFSIIQEYFGPDKSLFYHMDWYRLKDMAEAENAGVEYALVNGDFCLIEWPYWLELLSDSPYLHIKISYLNHQRLLEARVVTES